MGQFNCTFTKNAPYYHASRPDYPDSFLSLLQEEYAISTNTVVADIGSGTGKSSLPFLQLGSTVYAIEPNDAMRAEAEKHLHHYPNFISMGNSAEATSLPDHSIDLICVGQALHWFDFNKTKQEFSRIAKPGAYIVVFWNQPNRKQHPATNALFSLVDQYRTDPNSLLDKAIAKTRITDFFSQEEPNQYILSNKQQLDYESFLARLLSISHLPTKEDAKYNQMLEKLQEIFTRYSCDNSIELQYNTLAFINKVNKL